MSDNENPENFTVSLKGKGIAVEREVTAIQLADVMRIIMGIGAPKAPSNTVPEVGPTNGTAPHVHPPTAGPTRVSLREFLDGAKATTKQDQIVAIGQYMAQQENKEAFTRDDIKARFQTARERMPSNFPRDFNATIGNGLIAEDHTTPGQFYVTKTGSQAVEGRFGTQN